MSQNKEGFCIGMKEKWVVAAKKADFGGIAKRFGIDPVTARVIRNRDVISEEDIRRFLNPTITDLYPSTALRGAQEAAGLLEQKIRAGKKIRIIGDYDIDGVNATYILYRCLQMCGANVDYEIPDRMKDGFGLNRSLIELAFEEEADTILTCDNGIAAVEEIAYAKQLGMTVVVTDHHEPGYSQEEGSRTYHYPPADAIVDPAMPEDTYPFPEICGAVVAWKVMRLLLDRFGLPLVEWLKFLPFAAFATVGDVMELRDENRAIVRLGLEALECTGNIGVRALIRSCGLEGKRLSAYHIGFILGPCINAGGRLDTAKRALALLLEENESRAEELADQLKELNDLRKQMTEEGIREACAQIESGAFHGDDIFVIYLPNLHESIAGIVAGKVRERYFHPVFILTNAQESGYLKGSGRSTENWSMYDGLVRSGEYLEKYGGHPMAAGLTLRRENLEAFRRKVNQESGMKREDFIRKMVIDVPMPVSYLRENLIEELELLEPFGKGNPRPVFAERGMHPLRAGIIGKSRNTLKFQMESSEGVRMEAMYFGDPQEMLGYLSMRYSAEEVDRMLKGLENRIRMDVLYYPKVNEFRGVRTLQINITGYR